MASFLSLYHPQLSSHLMLHSLSSWKVVVK